MSDTAKPACRELLPCPFCGGEAFLDDGSDAPNQIVQCSHCDASVGAHNGVEQWNRRATPPSSEAGKWVPLVPDTAMIEAGRKAMEQQDPVRVSHARVMWLWNDMLAASPSEPRQGAGKQPRCYTPCRMDARDDAYEAWKARGDTDTVFFCYRQEQFADCCGSQCGACADKEESRSAAPTPSPSAGGELVALLDEICAIQAGYEMAGEKQSRILDAEMEDVRKRIFEHAERLSRPAAEGAGPVTQMTVLNAAFALEHPEEVSQEKRNAIAHRLSGLNIDALSRAPVRGMARLRSARRCAATALQERADATARQRDAECERANEFAARLKFDKTFEQHADNLQRELDAARASELTFFNLTDRAVKMLWLAIPETREPVSEASHNPITAWVAQATSEIAERARSERGGG